MYRENPDWAKMTCDGVFMLVILRDVSKLFVKNYHIANMYLTSRVYVVSG